MDRPGDHRGQSGTLASDPILKNGRAIGYVTSASHGYRTGKCLVLGYVESGTLDMGEVCTVRVFGVERLATRHNPHVFDPDNTRMKT